MLMLLWLSLAWGHNFCATRLQTMRYGQLKMNSAVQLAGPARLSHPCQICLNTELACLPACGVLDELEPFPFN